MCAPLLGAGHDHVVGGDQQAGGGDGDDRGDVRELTHPVELGVVNALVDPDAGERPPRESWSSTRERPVSSSSMSS